MSGQPVKTLSDQNKFRNEYMESLNIRQQLDDQNLQANKEYLKTGVLPAVSQLTDNRTTSEILADTEKLKASIMSDLSPIANPQFSAAIIQGIQNHFLNSDGSLLRFLAQRAGDIVKEIQRVYKFGIVGDANDVDVLVSFISNLYSDRKNVFGSTKNYINSNTGINKTISSQDIDKIIGDLTDIQRRAAIGLSKTNTNQQMMDDFEQLFIILKILKNVLPTNAELQNILQSFDTLGVNMSGADDLNAIYTILDNLPKMSQVTTILNKIELNLKNKNDNSVITLLNVLIDQFGILLDPSNNQILDTLRDLKARYQQGQPYQPPNPPNPPNPPQPPQPPQPPNPRFIHQPIPTAHKFDTWFNNRTGPTNGVYDDNSTDTFDWTKEHLAIYYHLQIMTMTLKRYVINNSVFFRNYAAELNALHGANLNRRMTEILWDLYTTNQYTFGRIMSELQAIAPLELSGAPANFRGLGITKKRRGRPRGCGIVKQTPIPNFVGFGINEINQKRLNDNILTIRRNTRTSYPDMPAKKVSPYFSNIIKAMIGGGVPNYNDISNLPDEEKDYLYKVVQRSDMTDKLSIPTPSKDRLQKEADQFEIMKGQILSGNDSKELVKKFKLLILKLSRNGLLPRGESKDLLETLVELGY
jgi:hypothetical protein